MRPIKLAVVVSHPTQHFVPLYRELASYNDIRIKVFYLAENGVRRAHDVDFGVDVQWDTPMLSGYDYEFVDPGKVVSDFGFWSVDSKNLIPKLNRFNADWLWLHGYAQAASWRALLGKKKHVKTFYTSDSNALIRPKKGISLFFKLLIKQLVIRFFFRKVNTFLAISPANREYLVSYGAPQKEIVKTSFPVDIQRLLDSQQRLQTEGQGELTKLRDHFKIAEDDCVMVTVSKLTPRKRVVDIIQAFSKVKDQSTHLLIVGSGECLEQLLTLREQLNFSHRVHITGFVNQSELPKYLALSDIFIFASENEPYGAVVSEALPFSLPIIIAQKIGAIGASAIEGKNALLFDVGKVDDLTKKMDMLLFDSELKKSMSKESLVMSKQHDKSVMAKDIHTICVDNNQTY